MALAVLLTLTIYAGYRLFWGWFGQRVRRFGVTRLGEFQSPKARVVSLVISTGMVFVFGFGALIVGVGAASTYTVVRTCRVERVLYDYGVDPQYHVLSQLRVDTRPCGRLVWNNNEFEQGETPSVVEGRVYRFRLRLERGLFVTGRFVPEILVAEPVRG